SELFGGLKCLATPFARTRDFPPAIPSPPMSQDTPQPGEFDGAGKKFAIVASRFNERIVDRLVEGAVDCLAHHGVTAADVRVVRVPGAWEIPLALDELARVGGVDGLIALG